MPKKFDRKMTAAFETLLKEHSLDEITVSDLTAEAGITRPAFYYHYSSVKEYIEENLNRTLTKVFEKYPEDIDLVPAGLANVLEVFKEQKDFVMKIYESSYYPGYCQTIKNFLTDLITERTSDYTKNNSLNMSWRDKRLFVRFTVNLCMELIGIYFDQGMHIDPANLIAKHQLYLGKPYSGIIAEFAGVDNKPV